jgi:hypothetical protein
MFREDFSTEAEEVSVLETVTREGLEKTQQAAVLISNISALNLCL